MGENHIYGEYLFFTRKQREAKGYAVFPFVHSQLHSDAISFTKNKEYMHLLCVRYCSEIQCGVMLN